MELSLVVLNIIISVYSLNREELNVSLKTMIEQNAFMLREVNRTLEDKVILVTKNSKENQMELMTSREFSYHYLDYIYMASFSQSGALVSGNGALFP